MKSRQQALQATLSGRLNISRPPNFGPFGRKGSFQQPRLFSSTSREARRRGCVVRHNSDCTASQPRGGDALAMRESRPSLLLRVALAIALPAYALDQASTQPIAPGAQVRTITRHSAAYGLTARQKQGFDLLQVAQAEAAGLPPTMRAFVLWQVSRGYRRVDSTKAEATLRRAFLTTLSIEDRSPSDQYCGSDFCYVRGRLQGPNS